LCHLHNGPFFSDANVSYSMPTARSTAMVAIKGFHNNRPGQHRHRRRPPACSAWAARPISFSQSQFDDWSFKTPPCAIFFSKGLTARTSINGAYPTLET